jgi:hypothetical protein
LIQAHFDESQFEKHRQDGWKKLRPDAVPTIFTHIQPVRTRKPPLKRSPDVSPTKTITKRLRVEHNYNRELLASSSPAVTAAPNAEEFSNGEKVFCTGRRRNSYSCHFYISRPMNHHTSDCMTLSVGLFIV